jgi:Phosphodiester glycosidase
MPAANAVNEGTHAAARVVAKPVAMAMPAPAAAVSISRMATGDGSQVTVAKFSGPVRYALYDGSSDPYVPPGHVRDQSEVVGEARSHLLAAFNGGFKMAAYAGGYKQEGRVFYPLRDGLASLVISRAGQAHIGVWPGADEDAYSVRQNLQPLVLDGRPTSAAYDWGLWGATLGGGEYVARSAVGQAADGDLLYAGSMSASPYDLARALADRGARTAMELDINPAWVQLDVARHPGGELRAQVYGQNRPPNQYLYGWTRDFIAVLTG